MKMLRTAASDPTLLVAGQSSFPFLQKNWKERNKSKTIYSKNHEGFKNRKPKVQFYWFL